jgi:hypothetical protein
MIIYKISLPKAKDAKAFVKFMRDQYFPAVHKGATRIGQVTDLTLLERENEFEGNDHAREFYWLVGWSGLSGGNARVDDEKVLHKFEAFKADIKRIGYFNEMTNWHEEKKL